MNKIKKDRLINTSIIICIIILSLIFSMSSYLTKSENLISTTFLVNYLGVFLGIAITLVTYIHTTITTINNNKVSKNDIFTELKQNTLLVFSFFICSIIIMGIEKINFPWISLGKLFKYKGLIIDFIRNLFLFFSLYSMYDIIDCLFILVFGDSNKVY